MGSITIFLKKHTLWVGFLAVLAPLLVMLGLQLVWVARLKQVSALAQKAAHNNYLEAIGTEAQFYYRSTAERALNIPASLFRQNRLGEVAVLWKKKPVEGVRRLFLVDFSRDRFGNYFLFDPERGDLDPYPASDEALAIIVACTPLQVLSYRGGVAQSTTLRVDERDPEYRIILNPITDDASRVVGIAGMILDDDFFRKELLPSIVKKALPAFFPGIGAGDLAVSVRDASGRVVLATGREGGDPHDGERVSATSRFPFVFADWTMSLHSPGTTPEQWASANFAFNVTLSLLLAVVLVGGIALALRAADRAVRLSGMKSDFVSNVSHELRTPLASIRVFAELLRLGRGPAPAERAGEDLRPLPPGRHGGGAGGQGERSGAVDRAAHRAGAWRGGDGRERAGQGGHVLHPPAAAARARRGRGGTGRGEGAGRLDGSRRVRCRRS